MERADKQKSELINRLALSEGGSMREMIDLAGLRVAELVSKKRISKKEKISVVIGRGGKAAVGLSAAGHLIEDGRDVCVVMSVQNVLPHARKQAALLKKKGVAPLFYSKDTNEARKQIRKSSVVVDALIGSGLHGTPREVLKELVYFVRDQNTVVLSCDVPSGVDAHTGICFDPCVDASFTVSFGFSRYWLEVENARKKGGQIYLADIGIPKSVYKETSLKYPFSKSSLVKLF